MGTVLILTTLIFYAMEPEKSDEELAKVSLVPPDCGTCPNRQVEQSDRSKGKWGAYLFALMLGALALMFSVERAPDGTYQRSADPPFLVWAVLLPVMGACLGVQVNPEQIGQAISKVSK